MVRMRLATLAIAGLLTIGLTGVSAGVAQSAPPPAPQPPAAVVGKQARPAIQPNSVNAKVEAPRGPTKTIKINPQTGAPASKAIAADASVSLGAFYNYAWREYVYTSVTNTSSVTKWVHLQLYVPGQSTSTASSYKDFYTSVPAGGTVYPFFYGVTGTYYAYLYVWNGGPDYVYDESKTSANNTSVSVTVAKTVYSGYVLATFKNNGNNYVTINSQELAPYPGAGTYTGGPKFDYPAAGGGTISRYYYVGVGLPYGIVADVDGSSIYNSFRFFGTY